MFTFDLAYARFDNICSDTLIVEIYTECGEVFQEEIYNKSGTELITDGTAPFNWLPNNDSDWRNESFSLIDYIGETIQVKFINVTGNCNNLFIDNINLINFEPPTAEISASVTDICIGEMIYFENTSTAALANTLGYLDRELLKQFLQISNLIRFFILFQVKKKLDWLCPMI